MFVWGNVVLNAGELSDLLLWAGSPRSDQSVCASRRLPNHFQFRKSQKKKPMLLKGSGWRDYKRPAVEETSQVLKRHALRFLLNGFLEAPPAWRFLQVLLHCEKLSAEDESSIVCRSFWSVWISFYEVISWRKVWEAPEQWWFTPSASTQTQQLLEKMAGGWEEPPQRLGLSPQLNCLTPVCWVRRLRWGMKSTWILLFLVLGDEFNVV